MKKVYILLLGLLLLRVGINLCGESLCQFNNFQSNLSDRMTLTDKGFFADLRSKLTSTYYFFLSHDQASLLSGIVWGSRNLDYEFKVKLARVGLSHVVAASWMNVTFFAAGILATLKFLGLSRYFKIGLASSVILFYAALTGFDPPIVRAVIMAEAVLLASLTGRQNTGWGALLLAAYLMLWVSPELIISPSFLLSFSAMTSQIFLSTISDRLPKLGRPVIELFLQSTLISLTTFPLVVIFFSNFSLISLISNPLVLWIIEPIMILGTLMSSLGLFFTPISQALALPVAGMLEYFLAVVDYFSKSDHLIFHYSFPSADLAIIFAIVYYLILFFLARKLTTPAKTKSISN